MCYCLLPLLVVSVIQPIVQSSCYLGRVLAAALLPCYLGSGVAGQRGGAAGQRGSGAAWQRGGGAAWRRGSVAAGRRGSVAAGQRGSGAAWQRGSEAAQRLLVVPYTPNPYTGEM